MIRNNRFLQNRLGAVNPVLAKLGGFVVEVILLADEPTGNLDPENAKVVLNYLRAFAEDGGTVLLVTHDDKAASVADKTLWMHQGRLSECEVVPFHDS